MKLYFKIYYRVLNLPRVFFQICISIAVLLLVYSINPSIIHIVSSIYTMHTCIHVFTSHFSILSFSHDIKLKFVALTKFYGIMVIDDIKLKTYLIFKLFFPLHVCSKIVTLKSVLSLLN